MNDKLQHNLIERLAARMGIVALDDAENCTSYLEELTSLARKYLERLSPEELEEIYDTIP